MPKMIDFDDPHTFPASLGSWDDSFESMIRDRILLDGVTEGWQVEHQLQDLRIGEMPIVSDFVSENPDIEVAVCHVTRLLDKNIVLREGLVTGGGRGSVAETRLKALLEHIGLDKSKIDEVFTHIYYYWDRDKKQRTESVHFMFDKSQVYKDDMANNFAISLGGEILRWSLEAIDHDLYKMEPYKRLWIEGTPSIVKFKCRLSDVHEICRNAMIAEVVKYYIVTRMYGYSYEFAFTGMTNGSIPPENIISIEEIKGFIEMQEKYPDFEGFYDELK